MPATQSTLALQMVAQLRLLDPSASAEIGTPERKLLDTVATSLYDSQIDLDALSSGLDLDSKYGANLDRFLGIFGFNRQVPTFSTGFVTFSRLSTSTSDIRIPAQSAVQAPNVANGISLTSVNFATQFDVILPAGSLSVQAPIQATISGTIGNVAANTISVISGSPIFGITSVTNESATQNGKDQETDDEYKIRFKNTIFRNLAGTADQYLALAIATAFTSKANVIGPQSFYREYIQIPDVDDASTDTEGAGGGSVGLYTTALSTIPYAKYIYSSDQVFPFVSNGDVGVGTIFYREGTDFTFNFPPVDTGDTHRFANHVPALDDTVTVATAEHRPNITFSNIYTGNSADVISVRPSDVVLSEFTYISEASRNDIANHITNAVDVFIDGGNDTTANMVMIRPNTGSAFIDDSTSKYYYENYRRIGEPEKRPIIGNILVPMFWQPVTDVPDQVIVGTDTYFKNVHYWPVTDISNIGGTIRSRGGIEWSTKILGMAITDTADDPSQFTGKIITDTSGDIVGGQPIEIDDYTYDKNIVDLQAALLGSKQITTDVLAHKARIRYFKLDITVMYSPGSSVSAANQGIHDSVNQYLQGLYFGDTIQLSDLLNVIHNVSGVDNVRWSSDTPNNPDLSRVYECNVDGIPLLSVSTDRVQPGNVTRPEIQALYINGVPTGGQYKVVWNDLATADISYNASASSIQAAIRALSGMALVVVSQDTRTNVGVKYPINSFRVTWPANGAQLPLSIQTGTTILSGGPYIIDNDFFLRDNELTSLPDSVYSPPIGISDTVPGIIIRPRAQNTWTKAV